MRQVTVKESIPHRFTLKKDDSRETGKEPILVILYSYGRYHNAPKWLSEEVHELGSTFTVPAS